MASSGAVARAERRQETTARPIDSAAHSPAGGLNTIMLCGKALVADGSGALYGPAERTLIVADLHLEKGSGAAARGTNRGGSVGGGVGVLGTKGGGTDTG